MFNFKTIDKSSGEKLEKVDVLGNWYEVIQKNDSIRFNDCSKDFLEIKKGEELPEGAISDAVFGFIRSSEFKIPVPLFEHERYYILNLDGSVFCNIYKKTQVDKSHMDQGTTKIVQEIHSVLNSSRLPANFLYSLSRKELEYINRWKNQFYDYSQGYLGIRTPGKRITISKHPSDQGFRLWKGRRLDQGILDNVPENWTMIALGSSDTQLDVTWGVNKRKVR